MKIQLLILNQIHFLQKFICLHLEIKHVKHIQAQNIQLEQKFKFLD